MNKLNIKLNQDYKQFKSGYDINLNGNLIIISGVNGSGKSQLMDIINGSQSIQPGTNHFDLNKYRIDSSESINNICLNSEEIFRRLFKDKDIKEIYGSDYKVERVIGNIENSKIKNKEDFWKKTVILPKERFKSFIPLFKIIDKLLEIKEDNLTEEGEKNV